jgi:cytidine deaminase
MSKRPREIIIETALKYQKKAAVLLADTSKKGKIKVYKLRQLLAFAFGSKDLK